MTASFPVHSPAPEPRQGWLWLKIPLAGLITILVFEALFLGWYWIVPSWGDMREGRTPESALIKDYLKKREADVKLPALRWKPIVKDVPKHISKVFLLAEDSRFYEHDGFDYEAIEAAMKYNWKKGKLLRGASTISQQTAKNMFLSLSRNPLRKWHEVLLTYMLEAKLSKAQILHSYLNVAEFGLGIYGIEAASQIYFHTSATNLSEDQAAQLAATLPSPKKHNPATQTKAFHQRDQRVSSAIHMIDQYLAQKGKKPTGAASALPTDAELAEKLREAMADPASEKSDDVGDDVGDEGDDEVKVEKAGSVVGSGSVGGGSTAEAKDAEDKSGPKVEELSGEALEAAKGAPEAGSSAPIEPVQTPDSPGRRRFPMTRPYWLDIPLIEGSALSQGASGEIIIVGSGLAGVSTAYWLQQKGFRDLTLVDFRAADAASFRNCGHILYGTVESMLAMASIHGEDIAKELWSLSIDICHDVRDTVRREQLAVDYKQDGYLVIAVDDSEHQEIHKSLELLHKFGFQSDYVSKAELEKKGFRNVHGGRFEAGSAQAHPTKFRNALIELCIERGLKYHSNVKVLAMDEVSGKVEIKTEAQGVLRFEAAVIAANAYSPLLSEFFNKYRLVEPFRGQIMCSKPLKAKLPVSYPHSFDHGYEYAIATADNRLMLGGWRNHTAGGETGTYDLTPNPLVEQGLADFASRHYAIQEKIEWEYSWAGIMAASKTGFPFIGPTDSQRIFTVSGFTGHGFSWAHGSAKYLASIMAGDAIPELVAKQFNPRFSH